MPDLWPLKAGEEITEDWIAALVRSVLRSGSISAAAPLQAATTDAGVQLSLAWSLDIRPFQLTATLAKGGSAAATLLQWSSSANQYQMPPTSPNGADNITVYDSLEIFSGASGKRGYCFNSRGSGRWEILQMQC